MSEWGDLPEPAPMTEAEAVAYVRELYRLEGEPDTVKAVVAFGPATAFVTISALQLATRHPDMSPAMRNTLGHVIDQLARLFADTPGAALLGLGNHASLDVPKTCRYPFGSHAAECPPGDHAGFVPEPTCAACGRGFGDEDDIVMMPDRGGLVALHEDCAAAGAELCPGRQRPSGPTSRGPRAYPRAPRTPTRKAL